MDFLNEAVDMHSLPKVESTELRPLEKNYLRVIRIEWMISSMVLLVVASVLILFIRSLRQPEWIILIGAGWVFLVIGHHLAQTKSFYRRAYAIRQRDIIYRSGWLIETFRTCPFNRIQHSSVSKSLLERRYGLATLSFYTAGAEGADLRIPGLKEDEAHRIKEWINERIADESQQP